MTDVSIIGAGPAGLTAAIYALRAGWRVKIFEENIYGGQTSIIDKIENYPGFESISGVDFSNALYNQVEKLGGEFIFAKVSNVELTEKDKVLYTSNGEKYTSKTLIIANGLKRRNLGCKGEKEFTGRGVSYCATCDGAFFKSKNVVIVGGGNTAIEDALYLSNICNKVTMIVRKDHFRGEKYLVNAVMNTTNIDIKFDTVLSEINGDKVVKNIKIKNVKTDITENLSIDGVFIAIGYEPDSKMYNSQIDIDDRGYFIADETCKTNIPGIYVAGDCRIKPLRQIVTATSDGAVAGSAISEYMHKYSLANIDNSL